ncbi:MAG: hypothetical protein AAF806_26070, partial [Bacteroidota bacterium]
FHGLSEVRFYTRQVLTSDRKFKIFDLTSYAGRMPDLLYIKLYRRFSATFAQKLSDKILIILYQLNSNFEHLLNIVQPFELLKILLTLVREYFHQTRK